jgi:hypothetical protein
VARKYWADAKPAAETDLELFQDRANEAKLESEHQTPMQPESIASAPVPSPPSSSTEIELPTQGMPVPTLQPAMEVAPPANETGSSRTEPVRNPEPVPQLLPAASSSPEASPKIQTEPHVGSSGEPVATRALQTLEAHAPAAPFLNPVESGQPPANEPQPHSAVADENPPDFLSQPAQPVTEEEGQEARGFFSRLLRRANT